VTIRLVNKTLSFQQGQLSPQSKEIRLFSPMGSDLNHDLQMAEIQKRQEMPGGEFSSMAELIEKKEIENETQTVIGRIAAICDVLHLAKRYAV